MDRRFLGIRRNSASPGGHRTQGNKSEMEAFSNPDHLRWNNREQRTQAAILDFQNDWSCTPRRSPALRIKSTRQSLAHFFNAISSHNNFFTFANSLFPGWFVLSMQLRKFICLCRFSLLFFLSSSLKLESLVAGSANNPLLSSCRCQSLKKSLGWERRLGIPPKPAGFPHSGV